MGRKRRENKKSSAIVTRRTALRMNADPGPLPPKSKKIKTNNSGGGRGGGASSSKKKANVESVAIVTQSTTDQRGKAKLTPNSDSLAVSEKPNFKKRANVESSGSREKGKEKLEPSARPTQSKKMEKGKAKEDNNPHFKKAKLTISEERPNVQPASSVLTRRAKARMDSHPTPP